MASGELVDMWCRITSKIVKYGFAVRYEDLDPPRTGIFDGLTITLDQWYSDFVETDWRYVRHYYQHGVIPDWNDCRAQDCAIIEPLSIPTITLRQVAVRFAF